MRIRVLCHEGYKAQETPRALFLGDRRVEVVSVNDRWRGEDHDYFKVLGSDGNTYIVRYDAARDEWELILMKVEPPLH